ncbi:hypothetical protein Rhal01_03758 [Rubritalea halochordaticola]|uniref:Uncharacterized protein n=1 Tax=Rubritalea halochordaticola TaxID=714537 RepID=A0ABP9V4H7_9BACT
MSVDDYYDYFPIQQEGVDLLKRGRLLEELCGELSKYGRVATFDSDFADFYFGPNTSEFDFIGLVSDICDPAVIVSVLRVLKSYKGEKVSIDADELEVGILNENEIVYYLSDDEDTKPLAQFGLISK